LDSGPRIRTVAAPGEETSSVNFLEQSRGYLLKG
jgi:hypothetical protein